jgi:hypothetical protein
LRNGTSFDYLDGTVWTLSFTSSANQALVYFDGEGFAVLDFVNAYGAGVYAGFAPVALFAINYDFYHVYTSYRFLVKK